MSSKTQPFQATIHTINMRACMTYMTAALQCDSDGDLVQHYLSSASLAANTAYRESYTRAEQVAAEYMQNFVKDIRTAIRRGGLAVWEVDSVEKN